MPRPDEVMDTRAETNAESARAFLVSRGFVPKVLKEDGEISVVLTSRTTGNTVAEGYGRGVTERDALVSAAQRYRVEQADWDQSGIRIALEYVPTITATAAAQHAVTQSSKEKVYASRHTSGHRFNCRRNAMTQAGTGPHRGLTCISSHHSLRTK